MLRKGIQATVVHKGNGGTEAAAAAAAAGIHRVAARSCMEALLVLLLLSLLLPGSFAEGRRRVLLGGQRGRRSLHGAREQVGAGGAGEGRRGCGALLHVQVRGRRRRLFWLLLLLLMPPLELLLLEQLRCLLQGPGAEGPPALLKQPSGRGAAAEEALDEVVARGDVADGAPAEALVAKDKVQNAEVLALEDVAVAAVAVRVAVCDGCQTRCEHDDVAANS